MTLLSDEAHWGVRMTAVDAANRPVVPTSATAVRWDASGAVIKCCAPEDPLLTLVFLNLVVYDLYPEMGSLRSVSDNLGRAAVRRLLEVAISRADRDIAFIEGGLTHACGC